MIRRGAASEAASLRTVRRYAASQRSQSRTETHWLTGESVRELPDWNCGDAVFTSGNN
jgi:hypothetical protein